MRYLIDVYYDAYRLSSHPTHQSAADAVAQYHEREGMALDRLTCRDTREGVAYPLVRWTRDETTGALVGSPEVLP